MLTKKIVLQSCFISMCSLALVGKSTAEIPNAPLAPKEPMKKILQQFIPYAQQVKNEWQIPGMAVSIVHNGKIVFAKGFGIRNVKNKPVTANTIFDIASLTKSFTAVLLAIQIDQDKYNWNTKVVKLLPKFKLYNENLTNEFEVRDLIAHDSGLPANALDALGNFGYSIKHTMAVLKYIKPIAPFRSTFAYQDIFLEFAKAIIEKYSGESYTSFIQHQIFKPLGMKDSFIRTQKALSKRQNVAQPFLFYEGKNYPYSSNSPYLSKEWALAPGIAGGGIQSSAIDMAKWLIFNVNHGQIDNKQLVSKKNFSFIHKPQTIIQKSKDGQTQLAYGEGWFIDKQTYYPYTVFYHPGGGTGMHAFMAYIPKTKTGIVVLTNQYINEAPKALYRRLFDLYFGIKPLKDWSKDFLKQRDHQPDNASIVCKPSKAFNMDAYTGTYYNPVYGKIVITKQGDKLVMLIGPQGIKWYLSACRKGILKAFWPDLNGMNVPMLTSSDDLIYFTPSSTDKKVLKMTVPFLNEDGSGVFIKQNVFN